ncbi:MAG: hypothetical protein R2806_22605 [Saprospiraceae bacterium]
MEVFEALKSNDLNLISNDGLRNKLISYYSWSNNILNEDVAGYVKIIEDASLNIFNTRFDALWNGNYKKYKATENWEDLELEMIPNDYEELKQDKAFMYFLRSLKNQYYWKIEVSLNSLNERANDLIKSIDSELKIRRNNESTWFEMTLCHTHLNDVHPGVLTRQIINTVEKPHLAKSYH